MLHGPSLSSIATCGDTDSNDGRKLHQTQNTNPAAMAAVAAHIEKWDAPDGIVCASDHLAIAAKRAFAERGIRTPNDVAIIGCGGMEESEYSWPPLSTIAHPTDEIAATIWDFLLHRLEWPTDQPQAKVFQSEFVARESTSGLKKKR